MRDIEVPGPPSTFEAPRPTYEIDVPNAEDIPRLLELWEAQYALHHELDSNYYVPFTDDVRAEVEARLHDEVQGGETHTFIAREGGSGIGFVNFGIHENDSLDTKIKMSGEVQEIFVTPEARTRGVGDALMGKAEDYFVQQGLTVSSLMCHAANLAALSFHARQKYVPKQIVHYKDLAPTPDADVPAQL